MILPATKGLDTSVDAILLVNVAVSFLLCTVLQDYYHSQQKRHIKSNDTKQSSENQVEEAIGEIAERTHTINLLRRYKGARADTVLREGVIEISTALELLLDQALGLLGLLRECRSQIRPCLKS